MEQLYEEMIQILLGKGFGSVDGWFSDEEISDLRQALLNRYNSDLFHQAGIGNQFNRVREKTIRSDKIHWLQKDTLVSVEQTFFQKINDFIAYLNRTCYAGVREYEFHYAMYEPGSFYKKRVDQFHVDDRRKYSFVMYLTESWSEADAGELVIYKDGVHKIGPTPGRIVFFSSDIEHEVLPTNAHRMSLTGWMKTL